MALMNKLIGFIGHIYKIGLKCKFEKKKHATKKFLKLVGDGDCAVFLKDHASYSMKSSRDILNMFTKLYGRRNNEGPIFIFCMLYLCVVFYYFVVQFTNQNIFWQEIFITKSQKTICVTF